MKLLPPEPSIDLYNEGFEEDDILQRVNVGKALSSLLERIDDPLVVALDGQWGTGKSYFLKRWVGAHTLNNGSAATTIYFDAFEHDYLSDPLPALVSALTYSLAEEDESELPEITKIKKLAFNLAKPAARIGLALATYGASEFFNSAGDAITKAVSSESMAAIDRYWEEESGRRNAMIDFKTAIEALATPSDESATGSSLVFVIDELDRCRPNYALEVLEVVKHFFSVPHVHFVLGVNLDSLENSVRVSYGKDIDAQAYLKKFINVTLQLPSEIDVAHNKEQTNLVYLKHLVEEMGVPKHISGRLINKIEMVSKANRISIRDIGKIASSIMLASDSVLKNENTNEGWILVMIDLVITKIIHPKLHLKFLNSDINKEELLLYLGATNNVITEEIDGKYNSDYDSDVHWHYLTWLYLVQDGGLENDDKQRLEAISNQFGMFGLGRTNKALPMQINQKWLDQFSFYSGD